jgi:hypothetical protein
VYKLNDFVTFVLMSIILTSFSLPSSFAQASFTLNSDSVGFPPTTPSERESDIAEARENFFATEFFNQKREGIIEEEERESIVDLSMESRRTAQEKAENAETERELQILAENTIATLNPPFVKCDPGKAYDAAIFIVHGKADLQDITNKMKKNEDKLTIELLVDLRLDTSLVILDSESPFLKGRILVGNDFPKIFDYDIKQVLTSCIAKDVTDKITKVESNTDPLIIASDPGTPDNKGTVTRLNPIFKDCTIPIGPAATTTVFAQDFAKFQVVGQSKKLDNRMENSNGKVDLTLKVFVDLNPAEIPSKAPFTVTDDNRLISAKLLTDENNKNKLKIFDFVLKDIITECNAVSYLDVPTNIADNDEIINPLKGFS